MKPAHDQEPTSDEPTSGVRGAQPAPTAVSACDSAWSWAQRRAKDFLRVATAATAASNRQLSDVFGVSASRVDHWASDAHDPNLPVARVLHAARAGGLAAAWATVYASLLLAEVKRLSDEARPKVSREVRCARVASKAGGVAGVIAEALADGRIDEQEAQEVLRAIADLQRHADAAASDLTAR